MAWDAMVQELSVSHVNCQRSLKRINMARARTDGGVLQLKTVMLDRLPFEDNMLADMH